jgi:predicted nucleic acid-binding protein
VTLPLILVDTNVLVYFYDPNSPQKQREAGAVLDRLLEAGQGRLSVQSLAELINAALRKLDPPLTPPQAMEQVSFFAASWPILDLTPQIILEAARGVRDHTLAYYDAQIWAAARLNQIPVIFSEDFQDGQILEGVRFVNPFKKGFDVAEWL